MITQNDNSARRVEIIRLALLASYNKGKPFRHRLTNEDAPEIWRKRAENTLRELIDLSEIDSLDSESKKPIFFEVDSVSTRRGLDGHGGDSMIAPYAESMKTCKELKCVCFECLKYQAQYPLCKMCPGRIAIPNCEGYKLCPNDKEIRK